MQVIRGIDSFKEFLGTNRGGVFADTGFLYAVADTDDRLNDKALATYEILEELQIPIYINVICRMEFADLIFRKQLTIGAIETYGNMSGNENRSLFNFLKSIRDESTSHLRAGQSHKIAEGKLKKLRGLLEEVDEAAWRMFCQQYAGEKLSNEWKILEEEFGLEFIEVLEGQTSDIIERPLHWEDMIQVMGREGLRGPDAMIVNMFIKSRLPLLITTDGDIVKSFVDSDQEHSNKSIFHLETSSQESPLPP